MFAYNIVTSKYTIKNKFITLPMRSELSLVVCTKNQFYKDTYILHFTINMSFLGLSKIYLDGGTGLKFAKLFDDIAELFPEKKTRRLKDFIQSKFMLILPPPKKNNKYSFFLQM